MDRADDFVNVEDTLQALLKPQKLEAKLESRDKAAPKTKTGRQTHEIQIMIACKIDKSIVRTRGPAHA